MIRRLAKKFFTAEVMGITLAAGALLMLSYGISSSLRNTDTSNFYTLCIVVAGISYGLGKIKWNGTQTSVGMAAFGIGFVWISGAQLSQPLLAIASVASSQLIHFLQNGSPIDPTPMNDLWVQIVQSSTALSTRIETWLLGLNRNVSINDALIRNMAWTLALWACSAWTGWHATKRAAIVTLLPGMVLLALVTSYSEYRVASLWGMMVLLLLLMGVWKYRNHTHQWQSKRMDFSDSISFDNGQAILTLTMIVGVIALITPSISWRDIVDFVRERREKNEAAEMLGIQEPRAVGQAISVQAPTLPRDHLLDEGVANSEKIVMTIRTGELPPIANPSITANAPRYYWRNVVYDRYNGVGWGTTATVPQSVPPNTPMIPGVLLHYRPVHLDIDIEEEQPGLIWSGTLFSANIPLKVDWRVRPPSDLFAEQSALLQADVFTADAGTGSYQVETYVPNITAADLISASTDYPEDIRLYYLSLPRDVPQRVFDLSEEITQGKTNPYEKAKAIETYLRENYPYDLEVSAPPPGVDVADYFLFELKKGYCDYYATAMVVLARASGIPARFVSGYAPGAYDAPNAEYIIRELNAHSWVEIYFPEIGWIEFEPTASIPVIERELARPIDITAQQINEEATAQLLNRFRAERIILWTSPVWLILLGFAVYYSMVERWMYLRHEPVIAIDQIYQSLYHSGRSLAGSWVSGETSSEYLSKLMETIQDISVQSKDKNIFRNASDNASLLTNIYHSSLFVEYKSTKTDANEAWKLWQALRKQLFAIKIFYRLQKIRHFNTKI